MGSDQNDQRSRSAPPSVRIYPNTRNHSFIISIVLSQGTYTRQGSIVVLCMYLGQLSKLREELRKNKISVVLDARDEEELRNQEGDNEVVDSGGVEVAEVKLSDQVASRPAPQDPC